MTCPLAHGTAFRAELAAHALIVEIDPPLPSGHHLELELLDTHDGELHVAIHDCAGDDGSRVGAALTLSERATTVRVHLHHAGGVTVAEAKRAATAAAAPLPVDPAEALQGMIDAAPERDYVGAVGEGVEISGAHTELGHQIDDGLVIGTLDGAGPQAAPPGPPPPFVKATPDEAVTPATRPPTALGPALGERSIGVPATIGFGQLDVPASVVQGEQFQIEVGLVAERPVWSSGPPMPRPSGVGADFTLSVQLQTDMNAFAMLPDGAWSFDLQVTAAVSFPTRKLRLVALPGQAGRAAAIQAIFLVAGQPVGWLARAVSIVASADVPIPAAVPPPSMRFALPVGEHPPDLTIAILDDPNLPNGTLFWVVSAPPGLEIAIPSPDSMRSELDRTPQEFARRMIEHIPNISPKVLFETVSGFGGVIAGKIPLGVWKVIADVSAKVAHQNRAPRILILSREPYVPWELALADWSGRQGAPRFLGAMASIGRWSLSDHVAADGDVRPPLLPPSAVRVRAMAVVSGDYQRPGWPALPEANREARQLRKAYQAKAVNASAGAVLDLLAGRPAAQLLHFAVHGSFNPTGTEEGIILTDGQIEPMAVRGTRLRSKPFVFLNACQLGAAEQMLGDYAGMAEAFLFAGASGVVAPLWNVKDGIARQIALDFYRATFGGVETGEALRRVRARFTSRSQNATYLAYMLYSDPRLSLARTN